MYKAWNGHEKWAANCFFTVVVLTRKNICSSSKIPVRFHILQTNSKRESRLKSHRKYIPQNLDVKTALQRTQAGLHDRFVSPVEPPLYWNTPLWCFIAPRLSSWIVPFDILYQGIQRKYCRVRQLLIAELHSINTKALMGENKESRTRFRPYYVRTTL